jgi:hypothetical protein
VSEYWRTRWEQKAKEAESLDMGNFRQNPLGRGIVNHRKVTQDLRRLVQDLIPGNDWLADSMVGNPQDTVSLGGGHKATRSSLEHAYMANTIVDHLAWSLSRDVPHVMEIGPGFGGLAWSLARRIEVGFYLFVDHEVHLKIQRWFTDQTVPQMPRVYITPEVMLSDNWYPNAFDLAVCTRALGEMDAEEVSRHCDLMTASVRPGGIAYIVNWIAKVSMLTDLRFHEKDWTMELNRSWPRALDGNPMVERVYRRRGA